MARKKKAPAKHSDTTGMQRAVPIILFALAVFTMFCFITQDIGTLGRGISTVFLGLFSYGAYVMPLLLALHAVFYPSDMRENRLWSRVIFSVVVLILISSIAYSITYWKADLTFAPVEFFTDGQRSVGGGFIGGTVGFCLIKIFGRVGLLIITAAVLAIYVSYLFARGKVSEFFYNLLKVTVIILAYTERGIKKFFKKIVNAKSDKLRREAEEKNGKLTDDDFFAVDNGMQKLSVSELGIKETRDTSYEEDNPTLHEKIFYKSAVSPEEAEEMAMREKAEEIFYAAMESDDTDEEPAPEQRRRIVNLTYDDPDSKIGRSAKRVEQTDNIRTSESANVTDENADAVFTQSFDPFEMMMSEELASKSSSRSLKDEPVSTRSVKEDISELTEEELEREKRILDFERRKAAIIESRKAIPVENDGEFTGTPKTVEFRERTDESFGKAAVETATTSFTFDKTERVAEPPKTQPANYTAIGFGDDEESVTAIFSKPAFTSPETIYSYTPTVEEPPVQTPYTVYEASADEPVPFSAPYVEEPEIRLYEKRQTESYTTSYSSAVQSTPAVTERIYPEHVPEDEPVQVYTMNPAPVEEKEEFSYTSTKDFEEEKTEEFIPEFKPYQVSNPDSSADPEVSPLHFEEVKTDEASTLKIEREYIGEDVEENEPYFDEEDTVDTDEDCAEEYEGDDEDDTDEEFDEYTEEDTLPPEDDDSAFETEEIPPEERNPVVQGYKDMFSALREEEPEDEESEDDKADNYELVSPDEVEEDEYVDDDEIEEDDDPPFEHSTVRHEPKPKAEKKEVKPEKKKPDFSNYKFPSIDLLGLDPATDDDTSEINENTKILIDTLASFNVTASIKGVDRGPRITRYEVVPARGVKVNAITSLYNDICLNLAKEGVRMEAPIPGKSAIGFEIPNKQPKNVRLRELLECDEFINAKSKTFVAIGKDVAGNPVFGDISKYPHALICGATGMGKSVCINSIMVSMLYRVRPDEVKLIMVDPKKVEFKMYSGIPHLLIPVITESKQAAGALMWAVEEMERRYELIEQFNVRNLDAYNEKVTENPSLGDKLPKIVIVIDELADLMMMVRDPVEDLIMRIAQKARAAGIHLIIGTQRPSVQVITGSIKANIPTRMSCKVTSQVDSRTVFDNSGAEKLLNRGDMLYSTVDKPKPCRVQGAFVSDKEVENIMEFLKSQSGENTYDDEVFAEINKAAQKCGNKKGGNAAEDLDDDGEECGYYSDQQFLDAVELAIRSNKVSTSLLQRKLSIGYGKAAKYIDAMEEIGIVSEPKGQKPRDVLLTMDEWHEKLSRVDLG